MSESSDKVMDVSPSNSSGVPSGPSVNKKVTNNSAISKSDNTAPMNDADEKRGTGAGATALNSLPPMMANMSVEERPTNMTPVKSRNARKKEKLRKLQIPQPVMHANNGQLPFFTNVPQNRPTVQEIFAREITPLYANTSSRYLENLSHHPHFQYMYNLQAREGLHSAPVLQPIHPSFAPTTPQYLNNVMQHPLLCKSFSVEGRDQMERHLINPNILPSAPKPFPYRAFPENTVSADPSVPNQARQKVRQKPRKRTRSRTSKFDPYITAEEVAQGLKSEKLIEGVLRINPKQFQHSYVSSYDRSEQDILIDGMKNRNRALEGDVIIVEVLSDAEEEQAADDSAQKKGRIVFIKEKVHTRTCIGTLKLMQDMNRQKALFVPRDHRVPRLIIPFTSWPDNFYEDSKNYENTLFLAKITDWPDVKFAVGTIVCFIGQSGDMVAESKAILAQNDLDITPYGPEVRHLFPRLDFVIPEEEIAKREDCRNMCLFSIDPFNCRDIDDAMSCRELANGNYEIGVHISDVSYFLADDTILDEMVSKKATTVYLVEKAYHMLPDELCMLCSLFPGVDKLAFSVFWEITRDGQVLSHRFAKTVINSCCQLAYDHAQSVLDDKENAEETFPEMHNGFKFADVQKVIKAIGGVAAIFRNRRFDEGALRIDQPKICFHLNTANGLPDNYWIYESKASHQLIEEFMLLANMTVAQRIYDDHPKLAFLRCHPPPSTYMLRQLAKALKPLGIDIDIESAGQLHRSLLPYVAADADRGKAMVLSMLCAKPMTRAKYFCAGASEEDDFHHYALNVPLYTHFTSPIRRYADIMVHRLLSASLKCREPPAWAQDRVRAVAAQCNKQKFNAKRAGEMSTEMYTLKYIEMNSPFAAEAVVVEIRDKYIDVIVVALSLNRRIFFNNDFPGAFKCVKSDAGAKLSKMELTWKATDTQPEVHQVIEVFSILQVELHKGDMVKVEIKVLRPS